MMADVKQKPSSSDTTDGKKRAARGIAMYTAMESKALNFRTRWQECANYIQPRKGNILTQLSPGAPQTILLWDTTAEQALIVFAAGIVSFLTPPSEIWFKCEPRGKDAPQELRDWFEDSSEKMLQEVANSQFYEVWHEDCLDAGGFGSSLMRVDEYPDDPVGLLGFSNIPVGTFYWREDNRGKISTIARKWKWTAQQACDEFGEDSLTENLLKAYNSTDASTAMREFSFIEIVQPRKNSDVTPGHTVPERRPWECLYICVEDNEIIREDGYYENPYAGCRTSRSNNEEYGRGPGTQAMPNIKAVNYMKRDIHAIAERLANPPWVAPDDTAYDPDNRPGGVTYWDASKGDNYKPEQQQLRNDLRDAREELAEDRKTIKDYFFNDMFKLLTSSEEMQREKTAYEVSQMVAERLILFSPLFGRIKTEKLDPIIYRIFSIMYRNKRFKPLPAGINPAAVEFEVSYVSKIALAIKAIQNQSLATAIQLIQAMVSLDPNVKYLLKSMDAARKVLGNSGVPSAWLRSDSEIKVLADKDQMEAQRLQAAQAALAGSQTIKNLGPVAQSGAGKAMASAAPMMGKPQSRAA